MRLVLQKNVHSMGQADFPYYTYKGGISIRFSTIASKQVQNAEKQKNNYVMSSEIYTIQLVMERHLIE